MARVHRSGAQDISVRLLRNTCVANDYVWMTQVLNTRITLCRHDDSVMAVVFHPQDSKLFLTGAWNGKVRLQSADPPRVLAWKQTQAGLNTLPIHSATFSGAGDRLYVGAMYGRVRQYQVAQSKRDAKLEYHAEVGVLSCFHLRSAATPSSHHSVRPDSAERQLVNADVREKSKRSHDVPVTGLHTLSTRPDTVLVSTRDSRIRLYTGTSKQSVKFKGHRNKVSRIAATFSPDGMYVICGSDDGCAPPLACCACQASRCSRTPAGQ